MNDSLEIRRLKQLIKGIMKKKGYKYEDLAKHLDVSLTTVKRLLNNEDLPLSRFLQVIEWLGMSLKEIADLTGDGRERFPEMTPEQESFLAENTDYGVILEDVNVGRPFQEIQKKHHITKSTLQKYLRRLDRENLIELLPNGQVRRVTKNLKVKRGGPLSRIMAQRLGDIARENVERGLISGNQYPSFSFHFNTHLWMREKTLKQLQEDVAELALKYNTIATTEQAVTTSEKLLPVTWFFITHNTEINHRIFDRPKNI